MRFRFPLRWTQPQLYDRLDRRGIMIEHCKPLNGKGVRTLPRPVYFQVEWILKDYDRLKELSQQASTADKAEGAVVFYAGDCTGLIPQSVYNEAAAKLAAIDRALLAVPEEYRRGVFDNLAYGIKLPDEACDNTWKKMEEAVYGKFGKRT